MKAGGLESLNKRYRTLTGQPKTDNPEKLATYGTQNQDITQYVLYTTMGKQTQIT